MTLRCKPGDLAVVISGINAGKICRCLDGGMETIQLRSRAYVRVWLWRTDTEFVDWSGGKDPYIQDYLLQPIRNPSEDAQDETLDWLPVPQQERSMA